MHFLRDSAWFTTSQILHDQDFTSLRCLQALHVTFYETPMQCIQSCLCFNALCHVNLPDMWDMLSLSPTSSYSWRPPKPHLTSKTIGKRLQHHHITQR